jgi:hypothetical protein
MVITPDRYWWANVKLDYRTRLIERLVQRGDVCVWHFEIPRQALG